MLETALSVVQGDVCRPDSCRARDPFESEGEPYYRSLPALSEQPGWRMQSTLPLELTPPYCSLEESWALTQGLTLVWKRSEGLCFRAGAPNGPFTEMAAVWGPNGDCTCTHKIFSSRRPPIYVLAQVHAPRCGHGNSALYARDATRQKISEEIEGVELPISLRRSVRGP